VYVPEISTSSSLPPRSTLLVRSSKVFHCGLTLHQEKRDLEIPLDFLRISKKREILGNHGNRQEISGNNCKFLRRLENCSTFFLIFHYEIYISLITSCYLQLCMPTLNAMLSVEEE